MFSFVVFLGCLNSKGYSGPERPKNELAKLAFAATPPAEVYAGSIGGERLGIFDSTLEILPGNHELSAEFELREQGCSGGDIYRPHEKCKALVYFGDCRVGFSARAGGEYLATVSPREIDAARITVTDKASGALLSSGNCRTRGSSRSGRPNR